MPIPFTQTAPEPNTVSAHPGDSSYRPMHDL